MREKREVYYDMLRIIALFLVIFTHTGTIGSKLYTVTEHRELAGIYLSLDVFRYVNVPIFFMISGALLLKKEESIKELYRKRVARYIVVLVVISYFYFVVEGKGSYCDFVLFFKLLYKGEIQGHLWFLYDYIGYLILLPLLRRMVKNLQGKDYNYLIILVVLYKGITGTMRVLSNWGSPEIPLFFTEQAIFYPIVGYYLGNVLTEEKYTKKKLIIGAILSGVSILAGSLLTYYDYKCSGEWLERGSDILIPIAAITIFYGVRFYYLNGKQHEKVDKFCMFFGENSFGVYLFSIYLQLKMLFVFGFFDKFLPCIVACCLYVVVVMAFGTILVAILRKIPIVRRLL